MEKNLLAKLKSKDIENLIFMYGTLTIENELLLKIVGIEKFLLLTKELGGVAIYVQKYNTVLKMIRNSYIAQEFNGYNLKELSKKYDLSEQWIKKIVTDNSKVLN